MGSRDDKDAVFRGFKHSKRVSLVNIESCREAKMVLLFGAHLLPTRFCTDPVFVGFCPDGQKLC